MTLAGIRAQFFRTSKAFTRTGEKVLGKFLVDMIFGIIASKSVNLSEISRALEKESKTTAKHIHKRINRNLGNFDLTKIKDQCQQKQARIIDNNTYIYFDPTEVIKPHGKKFEAMGQVADGSKNHEVQPGYPLVACVGLKEEELIPLDLDLFSYCEEEFESENQKILWHLDGIANRSKRLGTLVLDRGLDRFALIKNLTENSVNLIVRVTELRKYYLKNTVDKTFTRYEIIDQHAKIKTKATLELKYKKKIKSMKFNIQAAEVDLLGGKIDTERTLTLIRAKSEKLTLYLLTNLNDLSKESVVEVFRAYLNRWKVEEFIRFAKQQYELEKFRVLGIGRIKNLVKLAFISIVILAQLSEFDQSLSKMRAMLINKAKRTYKLPQKLKFFLYLIADGLAYILNNIRKKIVTMCDKTSNIQLKFDFKGSY